MSEDVQATATFTCRCHVCGVLAEYVDGKRVDGRCDHRAGVIYEKCCVEGCDHPRYRGYRRCSHHRHVRAYYGGDVKPERPTPEHGTLARYRGSASRQPCHCDACREAGRLYRYQYRAKGVQ